MDIGLFDSGIGGLTVLKEIIRKSPNNRFIYLADNANLPYGDKTPEQIVSYADSKIEWMRSKKVDLVAVACNTTDSVICAERYAKMFQKGVVSIIQATVQGITTKHQVKRVGVIATNRTVQSRAFERIFDKTSNIEVISVACPALVPWIESDNQDYEVGYRLVSEYLLQLLQWEIDALIYGCTHYALISHLINDIIREQGYSDKIVLFDPAVFVADAVETVPLNETEFSLEFYMTDISARTRFENAVIKIFGFRPDIQLVNLKNK